MHRCLYVLDILKVLFDFVIEDEKPGSGTNTIVALVYACRTFQDTGLDILWRGIHSLFPLIKCLPTDAWELNAIRRGDLVLTLKRPTVLSDWARSKTYTSRIRHLGSERIGFERKFNVMISADVLAAMEQHEVLPLPKLQIYRRDGIPLPEQLVLSPNLLELEIVYRTPDDAADFPGLLDYLKISSPFLRKLNISPLPHSRFELPDNFGDIVACLTQLEFLSVVGFTLSDDALQIVVSSQILRVLKSNNTSQDFLRCLPHRKPILPKLEVLYFHTACLQECSDLLRCLFPRQLQSITVIHRRNKSPIKESHVREFFGALEAYCTPDVLTSIILHQGESSNYADQDDRICTMDTLEPLLSFRNLRELNLFFYEVGYRLGDISIESMVNAWPHMCRFKLRCEVGVQSSDITLEGLLPIAKNWHQLESLCLTFTGKSVKDSSPPPLPGACCHYLRHIDIGYSSLVSNPVLVALFLSAIFPSLSDIRCHDGVGPWERVAVLIRTRGGFQNHDRILKLGL